MNLWQAVKSMLQESYDEYDKLGIRTSTATIESVSTFKEIMHKASVNLKFRMKLLDTPVKVLSGEGFALPEGFGMKFVEDKKNTLYIPLPPYVGEAAAVEEPHKQEKLQEVIQRAVTDQAFRTSLVQSPGEVLAGEGFVIPENTQVVILESTDDLFYVVLPPFTGERIVEATPEFKYRIEGSTVFLSGRLDTTTVSQLKAPLLEHEEGMLTIDCKNLTYISSAGLALLLMVRKQLKQKGYAMQLVNIQPAVRNVFILGGFDKVFDL
jgi:anti-sigma B factor antagonist